MREINLVNHRVPPFKVDERAELKYGDRFWTAVESGEWETQQLKELCDLGRESGYFFIDIGASNGVYSLILASLGNQVLAIEPDFEQFSALSKNLSLNPKLEIAADRAIVGVGKSLNLSPYSLDQEKNNTSEIKVIDIRELLPEKKKKIFKIDIEGGEWQLFRSRGLIKSIRESGDTEIFLSPHIGFFSETYSEGILERVKFRFGVLRELSTLYRISRQATLRHYQGVAVTPFELLKFDRIFGGPGFRHHIRLSFGMEK